MQHDGVVVGLFVAFRGADFGRLAVFDQLVEIPDNRIGVEVAAVGELNAFAELDGQRQRIRIHIDAENYRAKREESLQRLARKTAGKALKYRRNMMLEPMNAYERHVIHAALQDHPDVTTFSTGTEPNRRIVVAYSRYKSAEAAVKEDFPETEEE